MAENELYDFINKNKKNKNWNASIYVLGKQIHLGSFATFSDAQDSRKNAEILYGYDDSHGKDL